MDAAGACGSACRVRLVPNWNKGRIVGQKAPFKLEDIWALRVRSSIRVLGAGSGPRVDDYKTDQLGRSLMIGWESLS
jgi:hypothetical protein